MNRAREAARENRATQYRIRKIALPFRLPKIRKSSQLPPWLFSSLSEEKKEMPFLKKNLTFRDPSFISFFRRIQISIASLSPYFSLVNVKKFRRIDRIERMRAMKIERIYLLFIGGNKRR